MFEELAAYATFLHWVLAIGVTLLVLDLFCNTEVLAWISLFCFATWGTFITGAPIQWNLLLFMLYLALGVALYYTLWARLVRPFVVALFLKHAPQEDDELLVGRCGTIVGTGEDMHIRIADELWPVAQACRQGFSPGDRAVITALQGGIATITRVEREVH